MGYGREKQEMIRKWVYSIILVFIASRHPSGCENKALSFEGNYVIGENGFKYRIAEPSDIMGGTGEYRSTESKLKPIRNARNQIMVLYHKYYHAEKVKLSFLTYLFPNGRAEYINLNLLRHDTIGVKNTPKDTAFAKDIGCLLKGLEWPQMPDSIVDKVYFPFSLPIEARQE
jgi:hypothetical protein